MRFTKIKTFILFAFLFSLVNCFLNLAYADTVVTQLSRDKVSLNETFIVTYILNNTTTQTPDFSPLEKDFHIIASNYVTSFKIINGVTQKQTDWQITLEPKATGELIIPEINFGHLTSAEKKVLVNLEENNTQAKLQDTSVFVKAHLNTTSPYVQSQVVYTFKLFYRSHLEIPSLEFPNIKDVLISEVGEGKLYQTKIKGEPFYVLEKNFIMFPQKIGKLIIPPAHFKAIEQEINSNMINDFFSVSTPRRINLTTPTFTLEVQKIPENFQGKEWIPAKNILLSEKWDGDLNQWQTGNPITRTITLEAQGLRGDQIPDLSVDSISGVNMYTDPPHRSNRFQDNSITGVWTQKITYIPNQAQSFTIPALTVNWWNTQTDRNDLAQLKSISVQVQGKPISAQTEKGIDPSNTSKMLEDKQTPVPITTNLIPQAELESKSIAIQNSPFYFSMWFWISISLFCLWLITLLISFRKTNNSHSNEIKTNSKIIDAAKIKNISFNQKTFAKACKQGNPALAHKQLLSWAEIKWPKTSGNLRKLKEMVQDEQFRKELEHLEKALYANSVSDWQGGALLKAHRSVGKKRSTVINKFKNMFKRSPKDPLPPLNP